MDTRVPEAVPSEIDIGRIMALIPHRYPFLLIDRIVEMVPEVRCTGIKNVTFNEPHFVGHFPGRPVMPGVLIIEALAQTAAVLAIHSTGPEAAGKLIYIVSIESCRFRRPVVPGDRLELQVSRHHRRGDVWKFKGRAVVDGTAVADAVYSAILMDDE